METVVIVDALRTPIGSFMGSLNSFSATQLGTHVVKSILNRTKISPDDVDELIFGNVLSAGIGQAPARQVAIFSGLNPKTECLTINKMCGSGLKAVMLAEQSIKLSDAEIIFAGGMESMSNAPYLIEKIRSGIKMGNTQLIDSMIKDGLWDVYNDFHMGNAAELCAKECSIPRQAQDEFSIESYKRAQASTKNGIFKNEIAPITIEKKKGELILIDEDEEPFKTNFDKIPTLKPAFQKDGTVTAANSSKINDGAAALLLMSESKSKKLNLKPRAKIIASTSSAKKPEWFTTAPIDAIEKVLLKANMKIEEIDLFEINEAFSVVTIAAENKLNISNEKVNIFGGAVALGHPIGASGARILVTLLNALEQKNKKFGLAAICIGGGEASAIIIERL
ncbi:MAG: thiolase family protein [Bacteroidota bacterium]